VVLPRNGATLERDVRPPAGAAADYGIGVNAVLLARNWRSMPPIPAPASSGSRGFKRFIDESASHSPASTAIRKRPGVRQHADVIVGYSGGFLPTPGASRSAASATCPRRGAARCRLRRIDKFASWIENKRSGFFVSSYYRYTKRRTRTDVDAARKSITVTRAWIVRCVPASVCFVQTAATAITTASYVTQAWTELRSRSAGQNGGDAGAGQVASAPLPASR